MRARKHMLKTLDHEGGNYAKQTSNSKIVKQAYPSGMFISGEQKQLRKILMQDIMSDLEQNPDITYQEAAAHYIDTAELASVNEQPHLPKHIGILIGITMAIIVLCILLYIISNQFTPPTYYF